MDKNFLQQLIIEGHTFKSISKIANKSMTSVVYWVNKYDLRKIKPIRTYSKCGKENLGDCKRCSHCKQCMSINNFYKDGLRFTSKCKKCISKLNKLKRIEYRKLNARKTVSFESRLKMSESRKRYLQNHPETNPWKKKSGYSEPCEKLKRFLTENNIQFIEEYKPIKGRMFAIDIVFPQIMLGVEVNGGQHYDKDKNLTKYFQDRHDQIESLGWTLLEIPSNVTYSRKFREDLLLKVKGSGTIDMSIHFKHTCYRKKIHKPVHEVYEMVKEIGLSKTARFFNCSTQAVTGLLKRNNYSL